MKDVPQAHGDSRNPARSAGRFSRRAKWNLALGISGLIYVALTLMLSLNAPLFSILFIGLAGYELITGRNR
jgi:hypothetical protein